MYVFACMCAINLWEDTLVTQLTPWRGIWWLGDGEKGEILLNMFLYLLYLGPCK